MKSLFLLFLAAIVVAELSEECQFVANTRLFSGVDDINNLKSCFETSYTVDQEVIDGIIRNLEIIHDIYPYTDIAQNPPSEPAGYFKKMNFTSGLEELKTELAASDRIVGKVFRPTMKLINGFRDGHFSLSVKAVSNKYDNMFSDLGVLLPFELEVKAIGDLRQVFIHSPDPDYLSSEQCDQINRLYNEGYSVQTVDGQDAFHFFANFFGDYNRMKSPQGTLMNTLTTLQNGFWILSYPLDDIFDSHTIKFSDDTLLNCYWGFINTRVSSRGIREEKLRFKPMDLISSINTFSAKEEEIDYAIKNFKPRAVREEHKLVPCGLIKFTEGEMNYIQIDTFSHSRDKADLFLKELEECIADFDKNDSPITVILPHNPGGSARLLTAALFLLMPTADYRTIDAMRKNERTEVIAGEIVVGYKLSSDNKTCEVMQTKAELDAFWSKTVVDDLGNDVKHVRTEKIVEGYKDTVREIMKYRMQKHVRKPTDIVIATDGFCFSSCANFVDNVIRAGGAITAGYGLTNPGDDLFGAGQCPSGVIDPADAYAELANNSVLGLSFRATVLESYDLSAKMDEIIPADYSIYPVDVHCGYYDSYNPENQTGALVTYMYDVYKQFQTQCNPKNKKLLLVSDECKSSKPHAIRSGYACGSSGEWDKSECRIATCEDGYVVDFENDQCVLNGCFPVDTPTPSSVSIIRPMLILVALAAFIYLFF